MKKFLFASFIFLSANSAISDMCDKCRQHLQEELNKIQKKDEKVILKEPKVFTALDKIVVGVFTSLAIYIAYEFIDNYLHPDKVVEKNLKYLKSLEPQIEELSKRSIKAFSSRDVMLVHSYNLHVKKLKSWIEAKTVGGNDLTVYENLIEKMKNQYSQSSKLLEKFDLSLIDKLSKPTSVEPWQLQNIKK